MLFIFTPIPAKMIQFDDHIFQMGWFNHQKSKPLWIIRIPDPVIKHTHDFMESKGSTPFIIIFSRLHEFDYAKDTNTIVARLRLVV